MTAGGIFLKNAWFTLVAVGAIALGVGAKAAIFSMVKAVASTTAAAVSGANGLR